MTRWRITLSFLYILAFYWAGSSGAFSHQAPQIIKVNPREAGVVDLEDLADSVAVLKLENTEESFFGYSPNIIMTETRVFMNTGIGYKPGKVFVFDRNGKFIYKVEGGGQGPTEVDRIRNIAADGDDLLVYGDLAHKVLRFSPDGELLKIYKVDFYANNLIKLTDQWLFNVQGYSRLEHGGAKFMTTALDFSEETPFFKPGETGFIDAFGYRFFLPVLDEALFTLPLMDTVFAVNKKRVSPRFFIDFGKYKMDKELRDRSYGRDLFEKMSKSNHAELKGALTYSEGRLGFVYVKNDRGAKKGKRGRYLYYDSKEKRVVWHYHRLTLKRFGAKLSIIPSQYKRMAFVSETFNSLFEFNEEELNNPKRGGTSPGYGLMSLDEAMAVMREEDNPYLFIYTPKNK